jgi:hypothetical protein
MLDQYVHKWKEMRKNPFRRRLSLTGGKINHFKERIAWVSQALGIIS